MNTGLRLALKEAKKSLERHKVGACVLQGRKIQSKGFNKEKTHPAIAKYQFRTLHAECDALLKSPEGDTVVVVRVSKSGKPICSKPCEKCCAFMKENDIKTVYYINKDGQVEEMQL